MSKKPKVNKAAYGIAKTFAAQLLPKEAEAALPDEAEQERLRALEEEVMWEKNQTYKSDVVERNLTQMIDVLHQRLNQLSDVVKQRNILCAEDGNGSSSIESKEHSVTIADEFDDINPRLLKDPRAHMHKDSNLISDSKNDGVFIDPLRLVLKTKAMTDNAKKLENRLEDTFGMVNMREGKGKGKSKGAAASKTRKSEAKKFEQKKAKRTTLEKDLNTNMELFQTRGVMDVCFQAPFDIPVVNTTCMSPTAIVNSLHSHSVVHSSTHNAQDNYMHQNVSHKDKEVRQAVLRPCSIEIDWPIPIKWPKNDPRHHRPENADGQFDPDLLLHYALERTQLPVYENTFRWLCTQPMVQECVVFLFWLCKVKFFQKDAQPSDEAFLVDGVAQQYVRIIELLAVKAHAEYEKDYVFTYLPYILSNTVSWAFHYLCPGSRHLYTKGFHKTILLQVIQIFHGIQLCPATVKANWMKLFPDDVQDNEADSETFPLLIASTASDGGPPRSAALDAFATADSAGIGFGFADTAASKPGLMADASVDGDGGVDSTGSNSQQRRVSPDKSVASGSAASLTSSRNLLKPPLSKSKSTPTGVKLGRTGGLSLSGGFGGASLKLENRFAHTHGTEMLAQYSLQDSKDDTHLPPLGRMALSQTVDPLTPTYLHTNSLPGQGVLDRTTLRQARTKPRHVRTVQRQHAERMDAKSVSPVVQQFLKAPAPINGQSAQPVSRSVPISWAVGGGADTHRRVTIPRELHDELSAKIAASAISNKKLSRKSHAEQMAIVKHNAKECEIVLSSGATTISRFSLDLIKRQRNARSGSAGQNDVAGDINEDISAQAAFGESNSVLLDIDEEEDLEAFLRSQGFLSEVPKVPDAI